MKLENKGMLLGLIGVTLFGLTLPATRMALESFHPIFIATGRALLATAQELERRLWEAADELRANSKLKSSEYAMPVLGLIFLRFASGRFASASGRP